jgi:hypothetical protein
MGVKGRLHENGVKPNESMRFATILVMCEVPARCGSLRLAWLQLGYIDSSLRSGVATGMNQRLVPKVVRPITG